jgi:hypothetical protein
VIGRSGGLGAILVAALFGCSDRPARTPDAPGPHAKRLQPSAGVTLEHACVPTGPELCFNARDDNCNGVIDEGCGVPTGLVQFVIAWNEAAADVDLQVTDPNGELVEVGNAARSGLVKDRDCPGKENTCYGQNLENVYLEEGDPLRGTYRAAVRLEKLNGASPPIWVTLGARVGPRTYAMRFELSEPGEQRGVSVEL